MSRRISSRSCCGRAVLSRASGCSTPRLVLGSRRRPLSPWLAHAATSRPPTSPKPWSTGRASVSQVRRTPRSWSRTANRSVSTMAASTPYCAVSASCSSRTRRAASRSSTGSCVRRTRGGLGPHHARALLQRADQRGHRPPCAVARRGHGSRVSIGDEARLRSLFDGAASGTWRPPRRPTASWSRPSTPISNHSSGAEAPAGRPTWRSPRGSAGLCARRSGVIWVTRRDRSESMWSSGLPAASLAGPKPRGV